MTKQEAIKFAIRSFDSALADQDSFASFEQALDCYRDNIRDTLCDCGCAEFEDAAWAEFDAQVAKHNQK